MKLPEYFDAFLKDVVNLNKTRIDSLEDRIESITEFIDNSDWDPQIKDYSAQGSWAHGTIIKPIEGKSFDADLIVFVDPVEGMEAKQYISTLAAEFRKSGIYEDKVRSWSHCVTIEYSGDLKVDIAPCVVNRTGYAKEEVCNKNTNEFELTAPDSYTAWMRQKNDLSGNDKLKEITRLLKYLRDIKATFSCKSILLTTILADQILVTDLHQQNIWFSDIPTALQTIVIRLDSWLQRNSIKPIVRNPILQTEKFSDLWSNEQYDNFRETINRYRSWIVDAINEEDFDESIKKWRRVFGDEFAKGAEEQITEKSTKIILNFAESIIPGKDLVTAVKILGSDILAKMPNFPHVKIPPYAKEQTNIPVIIKANEKLSQSGPILRPLINGKPIETHIGIEFQALQNSGLPFSDALFRVEWQVVNTDKIAANSKALRGGFYPSQNPGRRWEETVYRGAHWVQAFVINKRTNKITGSSEKFYVVIE